MNREFSARVERMRRYWLVVCVGALAFRGGVAVAETLPEGNPTVPIESPHFPDRLHAVVFRNWQLVEPARLAATLGATETQVRELAASMGLPPVEHVSSDWRRRGYITIVRRNWHLLPYEQILSLIDMPEQEFATALREDDFLFGKLGSSKPTCPPVKYAPPTESQIQRAAEMRALVERSFRDTIAEKPLQQPFSFIERFNRPVDDATATRLAEGNRGGLRFIYSYFGSFGDPLADEELNPYPDGLLAELAENGINGVWLHVVLRQLAPGGQTFPEFGAGHEKRIENLRRLVARAKRFGISLYLYQNEPRAMPKEFFANRSEMAGVQAGDMQAICTSDPRVRQWLEDSLSFVFSQVPDLGGVFTITASENLTSCASHGRAQDCPRCSRRNPDEIIAEVNATIARGVWRGNPQAKVIAWDWGWHGHGDAPEIISRLPKGVWLMSVSEWKLPIERGGVRSEVGEYSVSSVGPGPRAKRHWQLAREAGLKTVAKVQFNNSWELSAVPYLPVLDLVAKHSSNLAREQTDGVMLSWSLGGYPSANLRVAKAFSEDPSATVDGVLERLARDMYGSDAAPHAREAWRKMSAGFAEYPYHISTVYSGPQHWGPANLLFARPTGQAPTMICFPLDGLDTWRGIYPADVFAAQFEKVARGWRDGVTELEKAVSLASSDRAFAAAADLRVAKAALIHWESVVHQVRFIMARQRLADPNLTADARKQLHLEVNDLLTQEQELAIQLFHLQREDSRIGFEASNHYYYTPIDLVEKVINCEYVRKQLLGTPTN